MTLIAIEGIDGSGKGTQTALLVKRLIASGVTADSLSFPQYGNTMAGELVGQYLNGEFGTDLTAKVAALLYAVDRFETKKQLHNMEEDNEIVVIDRYVGSNQAHQSARLTAIHDRAKFCKWIEKLEHITFGMPKPALTILIDIWTKNAIENVWKKGSRAYTDKAADAHEADVSHMQKARTQYHALASLYGWSVVDAMHPDGTLKPTETIADEIFQIVTDEVLGSRPPVLQDIDLECVAMEIHSTWCQLPWGQSSESQRNDSRDNARAAIAEIKRQMSCTPTRPVAGAMA